MTREHATTGPTHDASAPAAPLQMETVATPGRVERSSEPRAASGTAVEIAPDRRDHKKPAVLPAELDIQLRTLVAHVDRNVALHRSASTQPDRDLALEAIDTRVAVALRHVPDTLRETFRGELRALLGKHGTDALERALARGEGSYGARAASDLAIDRTRVLQLDADDGPVPELAPEEAHAIAGQGTATGGSSLPHLDLIQRAFGHHDVSAVKAHVGGAAREAAGALGARAYASGDSIAFASTPDLHLAAHEAAHVVQQRGGVGVSVGTAGDEYERHADAVADLVVRGESAEALLDGHARGSGTRAVQRVAEPRAQTQAAIDALFVVSDLDPVIAQLVAMRPSAQMAREYALAIGPTLHRIHGRDIPFFLTRAQRVRARVIRGSISEAPALASRSTLMAAIGRSDQPSLVAAQRSLAAIGESTGLPQVVEVGGASYQVAAADMAWLIEQVETRARGATAVTGELVESAPAVPALPTPEQSRHPSSATPIGGPSVEPLESESHAPESAEATAAFRAVESFPLAFSVPTSMGDLSLEVTVDIQERVYTTDESHSDHERITVEAATRLGDRRSTDGGRTRRTTGGGVTESGLARTAIEELVGHELGNIGRDRIRVEQRDGHYRCTIGWDFPALTIHGVQIGFRINLVQLSEDRGVQPLTIELPISTPWVPYDGRTRWRIQGKATFAPNWSAVLPRLAVAAVGVADGLAADAAVVAAVVLSPELLVPLALGVMVADMIDNSMRNAELARRPIHQAPSAAHSGYATDSDLTAYGADIHGRVRAFCLNYTDQLRGTAPRTHGAGAADGEHAGFGQVTRLIAAGHHLDDIRAAARGIADLDARVLGAVRSQFAGEIDGMLATVAHDLHHSAGDVQYMQWLTRHLHACIGIEPIAPAAPAFRRDPCAEDPTTVPTDQTLCATETQSDPDAPNPVTTSDAIDAPLPPHHGG